MISRCETPIPPFRLFCDSTILWYLLLWSRSVVSTVGDVMLAILAPFTYSALRCCLDSALQASAPVFISL